MLQRLIWAMAALAVVGVTVYLELVIDIRTPTSPLAMGGAIVTQNKLPPEDLADATIKLKAKFGEDTKVWQGPTGIYARRDGDILAELPARTFFHEALGITQVKDKAVSEIMDKPLPFVALDSTLDVLSSLLNKTNKAILVRDANEKIHIITQHDVLKAMTS